MSFSKAQRIEQIVAKSVRPSNQEFHDSVQNSYNLALLRGLEPFFFGTLTYFNEFHYGNQNEGANLVDWKTHTANIQRYGTYICRKFGGQLEFLGAFDQFDNREGIFPHYHAIILSNQNRSHQNYVRLAKLLQDNWKTQNDDTCAVCNARGLLIECDGCHRSYHLHHARPRVKSLADVPKGEWFCQYCREVPEVHRFPVASKYNKKERKANRKHEGGSNTGGNRR